LKEGHSDKSKFAPHAFKGHKIGWTQAEILQFESYSIYRRYKETARKLRSDNPISQSNLQISPLWFPLIGK
jgi:hypothetical protein